MQIAPQPHSIMTLLPVCACILLLVSAPAASGLCREGSTFDDASGKLCVKRDVRAQAEPEIKTQDGHVLIASATGNVSYSALGMMVC